jgi:hypothetical protein
MEKKCPLILQGLDHTIVEVKAKVEKVDEHLQGQDKYIKDINGKVQKIESEVTPIRTLFGLTQNKLAAYLLGIMVVSAFSWLAFRLSDSASVTEMHKANARQDAERELIAQRQQEVLKELSDVKTFRALTEAHLQAIDRTTQETNEMVRRLVDRLGVKGP